MFYCLCAQCDKIGIWFQAGYSFVNVCEVSVLNGVSLTQEPLSLISVEQKHSNMLSFIPITNTYLVLLLVPEHCISRLAENCFGAHVFSEHGLVFISKEQQEQCFVWNTE